MAFLSPIIIREHDFDFDYHLPARDLARASEKEISRFTASFLLARSQARQKSR